MVSNDNGRSPRIIIIVCLSMVVVHHLVTQVAVTPTRMPGVSLAGRLSTVVNETGFLVSRRNDLIQIWACVRGWVGGWFPTSRDNTACLLETGKRKESSQVMESPGDQPSSQMAYFRTSVVCCGGR